jgi:ribonuclease HI
VHDPDGEYRQQHPKMKVKLAEGKPQRKSATPPQYQPLPPADECETRVFTDGGCWPNPGRGGWGWVMEGLPHIHGSGREEYTTNQRMELTAAYEAIKVIEGPLTIVSDSRYLVDCFNATWFLKWERNNWMRQEKGEWFEVKNRDLWEPLVALAREWNVRFQWVKGHAGNVWNERADQLASMAVWGPEPDPDPEDAVDPEDGLDPELLMPMALIPPRL